jgi:hypothetical protein
MYFISTNIRKYKFQILMRSTSRVANFLCTVSRILENWSRSIWCDSTIYPSYLYCIKMGDHETSETENLVQKYRDNLFSNGRQYLFQIDPPDWGPSIPFHASSRKQPQFWEGCGIRESQEDEQCPKTLVRYILVSLYQRILQFSARLLYLIEISV